MKTIERILIIITIIFLIAQILLREADAMLFVTLSALTIYYCCFGFYLLNNLTFKHIFKKSTYFEISPLRIAGSICASMLLAILVLGILFRVTEYKDNIVFMGVGLISTAAVIIVSLVNYRMEKNRFYLDIVFKFAHWGVLGLIIHVLHF